MIQCGSGSGVSCGPCGLRTGDGVGTGAAAQSRTRSGTGAGAGAEAGTLELPTVRRFKYRLVDLVCYLNRTVFPVPYAAFSVADPDPGLGAFLTPGSQTHIFESLLTTFWVKTSIIL